MKDNKKLNFIINVLYVATIVFVAYVVWKLLGVLTPFIMALILVAIVQPLVKWLHKKLKIKSKHISVVLVILLYVAIGSLFALLAVRIVATLVNVLPQVPAYYQNSIAPSLAALGDQLETWLSANPEILENFRMMSDTIMSGLQSALASISQKALSFLTGFVSGIPGFLINAIVTIMLSVFIGIQFDALVNFLKAQLPKKWEDSLQDIKSLLQSTIVRYLKVVLILMAITFAELCIGFLIVGVKNPIGIAAITAILDAFPVLGTGTVLIPWALIKLIQGEFTYALGLGIVYVVITVIRNIIEPKIMSDQLEINPIVSLLSMYVGYRLLGVGGMILMPMAMRVLLALHKSGKLKLYKSANKE
ncbi:sporulation integral membrane protein YtvI [Eubacteriales bacterium OttesenSCG-928-K08]|nr:sporulation integral membrane protein YtvI [Eubacteriales bacterium OttesenSCG-928-K08]